MAENGAHTGYPGTDSSTSRSKAPRCAAKLGTPSTSAGNRFELTCRPALRKVVAAAGTRKGIDRFDPGHLTGRCSRRAAGKCEPGRW